MALAPTGFNVGIALILRQGRFLRHLVHFSSGAYSLEAPPEIMEFWVCNRLGLDEANQWPSQPQLLNAIGALRPVGWEENRRSCRVAGASCRVGRRAGQKKMRSLLGRLRGKTTVWN